jgi:hypothetical protein
MVAARSPLYLSKLPLGNVPPGPARQRDCRYVDPVGFEDLAGIQLAGFRHEPVGTHDRLRKEMHGDRAASPR